MHNTFTFAKYIVSRCPFRGRAPGVADWHRQPAPQWPAWWARPGGGNPRPCRRGGCSWRNHWGAPSARRDAQEQSAARALRPPCCEELLRRAATSLPAHAHAPGLLRRAATSFPVHAHAPGLLLLAKSRPPSWSAEARAEEAEERSTLLPGRRSAAQAMEAPRHLLWDRPLRAARRTRQRTAGGADAAWS